LGDVVFILVVLTGIHRFLQTLTTNYTRIQFPVPGKHFADFVWSA